MRLSSINDRSKNPSHEKNRRSEAHEHNERRHARRLKRRKGVAPQKASPKSTKPSQVLPQTYCITSLNSTTATNQNNVR